MAVRMAPAVSRGRFTPAAPGRTAARTQRPWWQQAGFWVVLAVGALLRLPGVLHSPFGLDDALLFLEVARASAAHLLPITSTFSSIGTLNMVSYSWLIYPFASHPMGMVVVTALANVLSVGALYVLVESYFGNQHAAVLAGLLLATSPYDSWMSVFLWPQTVLIPVGMGALLLLFQGVVRGQRGWLGPCVILIGIAVQIHPIMAAFVPALLVGVVLTWSSLRWRDLLIAFLGTVPLFAPTVLFEWLSHGLDLPVYQAWLSAPKHLDGQTLSALSATLGPRPATYLGAGTLYAASAGVFSWIAPALDVLAVLSCLWLLCVVAMPVWDALHMGGRSGLRGLAADPLWRAYVLLALTPLVLLATTLSHATPVYAHYVFVIDPVLYSTIALFLMRLTRMARQGRWLLTSFTDGLLASQFTLVAIFIFVLASGQAAGDSWGGTPVTSYTHALQVAGRLAAQAHSGGLYYLTGGFDPYMGAYWTTVANAARTPGAPAWASIDASGCVVTAAPQAGPSTLLVTNATTLAWQQVASEPGTRVVATIPVARGVKFQVAEVAPATPVAVPLATINGELRLDTARAVVASMSPLASTIPARLVTTWSALVVSPRADGADEYLFHFLFTGPDGLFAEAETRCSPTVWAAGETLTVVVPLPPVVAYRTDWSASVIVSRDTHYWYQPRLGALRFETAKELRTTPVVLRPGPVRGTGIAHPTQAQLDAAAVAFPMQFGAQDGGAAQA